MDYKLIFILLGFVSILSLLIYLFLTRRNKKQTNNKRKIILSITYAVIITGALLGIAIFILSRNLPHNLPHIG